MPFFETPYPQVTNSLNGPTAPKTSYLVFYSSVDPQTGRMWCPDCRDVADLIKSTFSPTDAPKAIVHWVGQRDEWKLPGGAQNQARTVWGVKGVPTVMKIQEGKEVARLVEDEITPSRLAAFIKDE